MLGGIGCSSVRRGRFPRAHAGDARCSAGYRQLRRQRRRIRCNSHPVADQEAQRADPHVQLRSEVMGTLRGGMRGHASDAAAATGTGPGRRAACAALRTRRRLWSRRRQHRRDREWFSCHRVQRRAAHLGVVPVPQHRTTPTLSCGTAFGVLMMQVTTDEGARKCLERGVFSAWLQTVVLPDRRKGGDRALPDLSRRPGSVVLECGHASHA